MSLTVQEIIDEIQAESVIDLADATLLNHFKAGLRYISALVHDRVFLTEGTITLAANAQTASLGGLSSGFIAERVVWYVSEGSRIIIPKPPSLDYFHGIYTTVGTGAPAYYRIYGTTFQADKLADQAYTIGLDYFKEISAVALTDTFIGDERLIQAAKYACKSEYYSSYEEDEVKALRNENKCKEMISQIQGDYEAAEMGGYVDEHLDYD